MNSRPKKQKMPDAGAPLWMASYGDLVTNLLCLFVLLYSFAIVDSQKFQQVAESMRMAFSGGNNQVMNQKDGDTFINITPYDISKVKETDDGSEGTESDEGEAWDGNAEGTKKVTVESVKVDIEKLIDEMGLNENIKVIEQEDIVIFRVDSLILFDSGRAELKDTAKPVIEKMGLILKDLKTDILVQGHADDRPISTSQFPSNWELSTKRATNVVKYLTDKSGIEQKYLTATGNAEFKPIAPNDTEYNRQKNRRIDIVIAKP